MAVSTEAGYPLRLVDATGAEVLLDSPPTRVVSLVPSGTLTLLALGAGDLLVGRTDYDTAAALAGLPSVGGGIGPSLERLVSMRPDLVILFGGESDHATPRRLTELGIRHLAIRPDGVEDVKGIIRQLGLVTGRTGVADTLLGKMDATLAEIRSAVQDLPPVRVAYLLGGSPPWVAGSGTYIHELLTLAGGVNVFADLGRLYGPISPEELLVREIDLLLAPEGGDIQLPELPIPLNRLPPEFELPGPGLASSARELAGILHPEAFR